MLPKRNSALRHAIASTLPAIGAFASLTMIAPPAQAQNAFVSATGTFNANSGQFIDFNFTVGSTDAMTFKTYASSGGTNAAGAVIASGGIDSRLALINSGNATIAFNDDANDNSNITHDSLLSPSGTGSSHLTSVAAGSYRLRMDNFTTNIGNGAFAVDLIDPTNTFTVNSIAISPSATLKTLTLNSPNTFSSTQVNIDSLHPLVFASGGTLIAKNNSVVELDSGTLNATVEQFQSSPGESVIFQNGGSNISNLITLGQLQATAGGYFMSGGTASAIDLFLGGGTLSFAELQNNGGTISLSDKLSAGGGLNSISTITLNSGGINAPLFTLGNGGTATFLQTGGAASFGDVSIGAFGSASGTCSLQGGSFVATSVAVGSSGLGTLNIGISATATVTNALSVSPQGFVSLTGGTLNAGTITVGSGGALGTFTFSAGTLNITNDSLRLGNGGLIGSNLILSNKNVFVSGTATIDNGAAVQINGGTFSVGTLVNNGSFQFNTGTFKLTASNLTVGTAGLFGPNLEIKSGQFINVQSVANNLTVGPNALLTISGGSLTASGSVNLMAAGQIQLNGLPSQISAGSINNSGLISGSGRLLGVFTNASSGEVRANPGDSLEFQASSSFNAGKVNLFGGGIDFTGALTNAGTISGHGTLQADGLFTNNGTFSLSGGDSDVTGTIQNNGKLTVTGNSTATFFNPVTNGGSSNFQVSANSTAVFLGLVTNTSAFTGLGLKDFEAGASGGAIVSVVGNTLVGGGANVSTAFVHENALDVDGTLAVVPGRSPANTSRVNSLVLSGSAGNWQGKLDLADNDLILDYSGASPIQTIADQIKSGYATGTWNGTGITSSAAQTIAQTTNPHKTAIGYAEASSLGLNNFDGQSIDANTMLVRYTWRGDANLDGLVNALDFNALASNFGGASGKFWDQGDFNYDGITNTFDFNALASNFNLALPAPPLGTLIPEPTAMALAIFAVFVLAPRLLRRKRRPA